MTVLRSGTATDAGLVRHNNQDRSLVTDPLVAVADGMGGHAGGEVASQLAVTALQEAFLAGPEPHTSQDLIAAVARANETVFERAQADPSLRGMGTTLTAAALVVSDGEERIAIANVGDSRTYVFSQGEMTQLTEDHSVAEELVRQGQIRPEEVDTHPQRHILTRAIGIYPGVDTDLWEVLPFAGDRLVLCSDGLVREVTDEQIAAVLRRLADPTEAATELVARARAAGGSDNITVVVVNIVDDDDRALTASRAIDATGVSSTGAAGPTTSAGATGPTGSTSTGATGPTGSTSTGATGSGSTGDRGPERGALPLPPGATDGRGEEAVAISAYAPAAGEPVPPLPRRPRRVTVRLIGFVLVIVLVFAGGAIAVVTYARDSYYVGLGSPGPAQPPASARPLVIYKGRPGGLLWFKPTLAQRTQVLSTQVLPSRLPDLQKGRQEPNLAAARSVCRQPRTGGGRRGRGRRRISNRLRTRIVDDDPAVTAIAPLSRADRRAQRQYRRARRRLEVANRTTELGLIVLVAIIVTAAYVLASLGLGVAAGGPRPVPRGRARPLRRRSPGVAGAGAPRRPRPPADRRAAERPRLRDDRPAQPSPGRTAGHVVLHRRGRLCRHPGRGPPSPRPRPLPLPSSASEALASSCCLWFLASGTRSAAPASGCTSAR